MSARPSHLVARFFGSLLPRRVHADDREWVAAKLIDAERALWEEMPRADQVESVGVARRADATLPRETAYRDEYLAAALLHDVGKQDAALGTFGRTLAMVLGAVTSATTVSRWAARSSFVRRSTLYLDHAALGARRIESAGCRRRAAEWARAHHDAAAWPTRSIPLDVCRELARADGERV